MQLEAGIDWITTTFPTDNLKMQELHESLEYLYGSGCLSRASTWASLGYVGYRMGKVSWGDREDGSIVVATGGDAHHYVKSGGPTGPNVSRMDLQTTIWGHEEADLDITEMMNSAIKSREAIKGRWKINHVDGCGGGDTLYIGSRQSEAFIRIYNKGAESREAYYEGSIRYEIELKGNTARACLDTIRSREFDEGAILGAILDVFSRRGMDAEFSHLATGVAVGTPRRAAADDEGRLNWLKTQVRPTVRRLLSTQGRDTILEVLGLTSAFADETTL